MFKVFEGKRYVGPEIDVWVRTEHNTYINSVSLTLSFLSAISLMELFYLFSFKPIRFIIAFLVPVFGCCSLCARMRCITI